MSIKPTYEELEQRIKDLAKETAALKRSDEALKERGERMQIEERLRHDKTRLKALIQHSALAIATLDAEHNIISCNEYFEKLFQFEESEIIGKNLDAVIAREEYMEEAVSYTKDTIEGKPIHGSAKRYRKDGTLIDVEFFGVPVIIDDKLAGAYGIYLDIGERKRAEEALRVSEEKYRSLVESTEDSIYLVDRNRAYLFMNKEHLSKFGVPKEKVIGRRYDDFHSKEETKEFKVRVNAVIKTGKSSRYVYESERGGGHYLRTLSPVKDLEGKTTAVTVVSKDVTELIKTEEDLRQANEELFREHNQRKILSKRLIDLLENDRRQIARELHDHIGQTLTSLKMDIEMIHGKLKPEQREMGARIIEVQEKAIQAIKDVKNISRGLRPGILDALGLGPSLRELFSEIQRQTDIEINFFSRNIPKRFAPEKEVAIYRVAQEALTNIIRYAKAKNIFVNLVKKDENLSLSVEDDGVGFDQDKVMTFSENRGPMGILIMRERAEQFDGEFTLESQIGKGTHVLVEVPL